MCIQELINRGKQFLRKGIHLDERLSTMEEEYRELKMSIISVKAMNYDKDNVQGGAHVDLSNKIAQMEERLIELNIKWDELVEWRLEAGRVIDMIENNLLCAILREHYINGSPWDTIRCEIVDEIEYSRSHFYRLRQQAYEELGRIVERLEPAEQNEIK